MEHVPANSESVKTNASSEQGGHPSRQLSSSAHLSVSTASSSLIDDGHHRLRIWPQRGVSAVYPVPNIVVEYVPQAYSESGANRLGSSSSPHIRCLTPPHSARWSTQITRPSVSRQARALSDSSVHELEKLVVGSEVVNVCSEHVPDICMQRQHQSTLGRYDANEARTITDSHRASTVGRLELTRPTSSYLKPEPLYVEQSSIHYGPSSPRFFGPERSPKAYWLRRHSDSNLTSGHSGVSASVRTEPYPIRSHSTGDSALSSMSLSVFNPPDVTLSDSEMSSNIKSTAVTYNTRTSKVSSAADVADSEIACKVFNATTGEVDVRTSELSQHHEADKQAASQYMPTEVLDEPATDEHGNAERGEVLIEKRLKLKKYLQTRYQMSLSHIRQSLDNDDVFVDRFSSPGPCTPPVKQSFQTTAGHNIGLLQAVLSPVPFTGLPHQPIQQTSQSVYEYSRSTASHTKSLSASGSPNYWLHHEHGGGPIRMSRSDERMSVKAEPLSPGTVSSGASVFVFPPPSLVTKSFEPVQPVHVLLGGKLPAAAAAGSSVASAALERRRSDVPSVKADVTRPAAAVFSDQHQFLWNRSSHESQPSSSKLNEYQTSQQRRLGGQTLSSFSPTVMELSSSQTATKVSAASAPLEMHRLPSPTSVLQFFTGQPYSLSEISRHRKEPDWPIHHRMSSERTQLEDTSSLACPVCSIAFSSYKCLSDHMALHVSGSSLSSSTEPTAAAAKHVDVSGLVSKPVHLCPICQRTFSRGDMLTRHVRLHTGVRPYECTLCSQVFSRSDHLTTHQRTHTGEKPYRCPVCAYAAPRRDMVTRHARIHETSTGSLFSTGRRGRRTASVSACANVNIPVAVESRMVVPSRIDLPSMALRRHFSESGSGSRGLPKTLVGQQGRENETVLSRPHHWSLASSVDSAEGSVSTPPPLPPVTCRAWSTTSAESFESYPGACRTASSSVSSSVTAESPDVFTLHSRHFRWGVDIPVTLTEAVAQSEDARMPVDVAGVMPAFQKCSVTSPRRTSKHDSDVSDVE